MKDLYLYNSYSREKSKFAPLVEGKIGMYVCGPTVYNNVHLGNVRTFVSFDIIYRYLLHLGYKVRYVRNITDVGHLTGDVDTGAESKIDKQARLEQLEPMELVQKYTNNFHAVMRLVNTLSPSIEPTATGHLLEQIEMVETILKNGYAYIENGSVYFDTQKLIHEYKDSPTPYGKLSGKKIEDLLEETRDNLKNQSEKRHPSDFAIWIKADSNHLMRWKSPWSVGFPGWHLECSAMSTKYLGNEFDIHGGGMDLQFPHHENEIAQNIGFCNCHPARAWIHTNMLLLNGKKMSKSDGNNITPSELFGDANNIFGRIYSPMVFKLLLLQAHYSSTLDLTKKGLDAADAAYVRLMRTYQKLIQTVSNPDSPTDNSIEAQFVHLLEELDVHMCNNFDTASALSTLFALATEINSDKHLSLSAANLEDLKNKFTTFLFDVFGLIDETQKDPILDAVMHLVIEIRQKAREQKDFATSDLIRDRLKPVGIQIKDSKTGASWEKI